MLSRKTEGISGPENFYHPHFSCFHMPCERKGGKRIEKIQNNSPIEVLLEVPFIGYWNSLNRGMVYGILPVGPKKT